MSTALVGPGIRGSIGTNFGRGFRCTGSVAKLDTDDALMTDPAVPGRRNADTAFRPPPRAEALSRPIGGFTDTLRLLLRALGCCCRRDCDDRAVDLAVDMVPTLLARERAVDGNPLRSWCWRSTSLLTKT